MQRASVASKRPRASVASKRLSIDPKIINTTRVMSVVALVLALGCFWWFINGIQHKSKIDAVLEDPRQADKLSYAVHDTVGRAAMFYDAHMKGLKHDPPEAFEPFEWCRDFTSLQQMTAHTHAAICNQRVKKDTFTNAPHTTQDTHEFLTNMKRVDCSDADQFASRERTSITPGIINTGVTVKGPAAFQNAEKAFVDKGAQRFAATHFGSSMWKYMSSVDMREEFKTHWIACNSLMTSVKETEALMKEYWWALGGWCLASGIIIFYVTAEFFWYKNPKSVTTFCYFLEENVAIFYRFVMSVVHRAYKNKAWISGAGVLSVVSVVWWWWCGWIIWGISWIPPFWDLEFLNDYTCKVLHR
jgi:hypothetical protein